MQNAFTCLRFSISLALLSAGPAFSQTPSDEAISDKTTAAPVAYVYVQTAEGVNLYDAAANGTLTLVKGSPFKTVGSMAGSNRKYFFSLGTDWVHAYQVESSGAIGKQVDEINTQNYGLVYGRTCGTTVGAVLDHTGQSLYVALWDNWPLNVCTQFEAFDVAKASGRLSYHGSTEFDWNSEFSLPVFAANDELAYSNDYIGDGPVGPMVEFERVSTGRLQQVPNFGRTDPTGLQPGQVLRPYLMTPDPTNHMAMSLLGSFPPNDFYLASYTADDAGNLTSTNTLADLPVATGIPLRLNMSPSGEFLAVGSQPSGSSTGGLQVFYFNGAEPITPYSAMLTSVPIDQIHWDSDNHLYALSYSTDQLFVYTITPTTISEVPGSPYTITGAYGSSGLIVVPVL
jgi:hypothetical protein